jgi:hypothetical protein
MQANSRARLTQRINRLCQRFNEPVIPAGHVQKWLRHFDAEDRAAALTLLEAVEYHTYPRLVRESQQLHAKVRRRLAADGFDAVKFQDVDFSREFTCKSGDLLSFIYRKANLIPSIDFKTFDELISEQRAQAHRFRNRALVLLDDYIGTGSQFIFQFVGQSPADLAVLNGYRRIYLACVVAHEQALKKFRLLQARRIRAVMTLEEEQFPQVDFRDQEQRLRAALRHLDWRKVHCLPLVEERPLLAPGASRLTAQQRRQIHQLVAKYQPGGYDGTSYLFGHHTFFHGAPNALPHMLLQFFKRVEDLSIYPADKVAGLEESSVTLYDFEHEPRRSGRG